MDFQPTVGIVTHEAANRTFRSIKATLVLAPVFDGIDQSRKCSHEKLTIEQILGRCSDDFVSELSDTRRAVPLGVDVWRLVLRLSACIVFLDVRHWNVDAVSDSLVHVAAAVLGDSSVLYETLTTTGTRVMSELFVAGPYARYNSAVVGK